MLLCCHVGSDWHQQQLNAALADTLLMQPHAVTMSLMLLAAIAHFDSVLVAVARFQMDRSASIDSRLVWALALVSC